MRRNGRWCEHVVVWEVARRTLVPLLPPACDPAKAFGKNSPLYGYEAEIDGVALAGGRAAWISEFQASTYLYWCIETASTRDPRVRVLSGRCEYEESRFSLTGGDGDWVTNIVGGGALLAFNVWDTCPVAEFCPGDVGRGVKTSMAVTSGRLMRLTPTTLLTIASGLGTLYAMSADAGEILVLHAPAVPDTSLSTADGSLAVYRADGRLRTLRTSVGPVRSAQMQGGQLAALTTSGLAVVDAATGATVRMWTLGAAAANLRLEGIHDGVVVTVAGRTIQLFRAADGKRVRVVAPGRGTVFARLEASGLFYTHTDAYGSGRVTLVPRAALTPLFAR